VDVPSELKPTISPSGVSYSQTRVPLSMEEKTSDPRIHSVTCRDQSSSPQENPTKRAWSASLNSTA
jgi:hypothetical protein